MRVKINEEGVLIPRAFFTDADEADILTDGNRIIIIPIFRSDPIFNLGKKPVKCGLSDGSENHDKYLYGSES